MPTHRNKPASALDLLRAIRKYESSADARKKSARRRAKAIDASEWEEVVDKGNFYYKAVTRLPSNNVSLQNYEPVQPINKELKKLIAKYDWGAAFEKAVQDVSALGVPELSEVRTMGEFYRYLDDLVTWIPKIRYWQESNDGQTVHERTVYTRIVQFYIYMERPELQALQSPINQPRKPGNWTRRVDTDAKGSVLLNKKGKPVLKRVKGVGMLQAIDDAGRPTGATYTPVRDASKKNVVLQPRQKTPTWTVTKRLQPKANPTKPDEYEPLTPLSQWLTAFASSWGDWLDTPESASKLATFFMAPEYEMNDYVVPKGGWKTFNQAFARALKPGLRPIASPWDPRTVVSAADNTYIGQWEVTARNGVTVKHIEWRINELLADSQYADAFRGGIFSHSFLNTYDYHRQHSPVAGRVIEATYVRGQCYLEVNLQETNANDSNTGNVAYAVIPQRFVNAEDGTGYQFVQSRGLIVIQTEIGKVAVLPMGMAQVSSVIMENERGEPTQPGDWVNKGDQLSYFQFGGSDIVCVFEKTANVSFLAQQLQHYRYGRQVAVAGPDPLFTVDQVDTIVANELGIALRSNTMYVDGKPIRMTKRDYYARHQAQFVNHD